MRTTLLIPAVLIGLVACSTAAESAAPGTDTPAAAIAVSVADFMIDPPEIEAPGPTVTIAVTNDGPTPHNLTVRDAAGKVRMATADLSVGESETISAELEPGEYTTFCALPGHESLGMFGTLTVAAP